MRDRYANRSELSSKMGSVRIYRESKEKLVADSDDLDFHCYPVMTRP
jgi:hypothetical protein